MGIDSEKDAVRKLLAESGFGPTLTEVFAESLEAESVLDLSLPRFLFLRCIEIDLVDLRVDINQLDFTVVTRALGGVYEIGARIGWYDPELARTLVALALDFNEGLPDIAWEGASIIGMAAFEMYHSVVGKHPTSAQDVYQLFEFRRRGADPLKHPSKVYEVASRHWEDEFEGAFVETALCAGLAFGVDHREIIGKTLELGDAKFMETVPDCVEERASTIETKLRLLDCRMWALFCRPDLVHLFDLEDEIELG